MNGKKRICIDCDKLYSIEQFFCPRCGGKLLNYSMEHNGILIDEIVVTNVKPIKKPLLIFISWIVLSIIGGLIVVLFESAYVIVSFIVMTILIIYSLGLLIIIHPDKFIYSRSLGDAPRNWKGGGKYYYYMFFVASLVLAGLFYFVNTILILEGYSLGGYALNFAFLFDYMFIHHFALYFYFIGKFLANRKGDL